MFKRTTFAGATAVTALILGCSSQDPRVVTARTQSAETVAQAESASTALAIANSRSCPTPAAGLTQLGTFVEGGEMAWLGTVSPQASNSNGQPLGVVSPSWTGPLRGERIPGCDGYALHFLSTVTARGEGYGWGGFGPVKPSDYTGLALWVRGVSRRGIDIDIGTTDTAGKEGRGHCEPSDGKRCYGFHKAAIALTEQWREVRIPFASLEQPDWAVPAELDLSHAIFLGMQTRPNEQDVWVASLDLYR